MLVFRSFRTRLIAFFVGLLFLALAASFLAVNQANIDNAERVITADLAEDAAVFSRLFSDRARGLLEAARLLSSDFAFKTAYSTAEHHTILSAMNNHLNRISGADVMMLVSLDEEVLADTSAPGTGEPNPWPWIVWAAEDDDYGEAAAIVMRDDQPLQMMVVPLLTPDLEAWIFIGFLLDDAYAEDLRALILSQVSILHLDSAAAVRSVASTLPQEVRGQLPTLLQAGRLPAGQTAMLEIAGEASVATAITLSEGEGGRFQVVLQRSLAEELAPYFRLRVTLALLFGMSLVLSVIAAVAIARTVTRPVLDLAAGARAIEKGEYSRRVELERRDEIGRLAGSFNEMAAGLEEKERVRDLLGKVVSTAIAEELLSKEIELGGEERVATVLFSDVRNFTTLCEGRSPREILSLLNLYLTEVSGIIEEHGGVVDKYIGDAVMALFGVPLDHGDDAARAVSTALGMQGCLGRLNAEFEQRGLPRLGVGIGVHTGLLVAGNMGSENRLNYTVIGDGVNLASRLEGLTKRYGISIIVSDSTRQAAPDFVYRELDRVRVKGKSEAVRIYEPLGPRESLAAQDLEDLERFHHALELLRSRQWAPASRALSELAVAADGRDEALCRVYLARIEGYLREQPEESWDGTVTFTKK
jgi:adenylate cyclase